MAVVIVVGTLLCGRARTASVVFVKPENLALVAVLAEFISDARPRAGEHADLTDRELAEVLASLPTGDIVREAADSTAQANGYLDDASGSGHAGRAFDGQALFQLGVAALLRSSRKLDVNALAEQLASYLAGPRETLWRYLVLDVDWELAAPVDLGEWRLCRPHADDWRALQPVPIAADQAPVQTWDPLLEFGQHVVLTAPDPALEPLHGSRIPLFRFFCRSATDPAWAPLIAFNLWSDDPVQTVARYVVEPGRAVDKPRSSIPSTYVGPEGEHEVPQLGPLYVDRKLNRQLIRFLTEITTRLDQPTLGKKLHNRIQRSAVRFLDTADKVGYDADATFPDDEPQVVLNYVTSLENLLSGDDNHADLTRKTAQRAAILTGRNDADRLEIRRCVANAYDVRSKIAHGSDPDPHKLTEAAKQVRPILRRAIIAAIVLGEAALGPLCDEALLSHETLQVKIRNPLSEFRSMIVSS